MLRVLAKGEWIDCDSKKLLDFPSKDGQEMKIIRSENATKATNDRVYSEVVQVPIPTMTVSCESPLQAQTITATVILPHSLAETPEHNSHE